MIRRLPVLGMFLVALLGTPVQAQGDIEIVLDQFGVNGIWRPGEFTAVRVQFTVLPQSSLERVTSAWVQWDVTNADGDVGEYGRAITLTKGQLRMACADARSAARGSARHPGACRSTSASSAWWDRPRWV